MKINSQYTCLYLILNTTFLLGGCVSKVDNFEKEVKKITYLNEKSEDKPEAYRMDYINERQKIIESKFKKSQQAVLEGNINYAVELNQQILTLDSHNEKAQSNIKHIESLNFIKKKYDLAQKMVGEKRYSSALNTIKEILQIDPSNTLAVKLRNEIQQSLNTQYLNPNNLNDKLDKLVSIEFKNASVYAVLDVLSQQSGLNFIFDKDTNLDQATTTIFAKNTTVREALETILYTSSLSYKILNSNTYLIYKKNDESQKKYEELVTKSYYLGHADSLKAQDMITKLYQPKGIFFDDRLRMLIIRDNQNVINSIDKLLQAYDIPSPEVLLDIEVLEVSRDSLLNLGIDFPNKIEGSVLNSIGGVGTYTLNELKNITKDSVSLVVTDPKVALNFKQESNKANLLANPRIRIKSREKADFLIGDKVPVITTTTSELGGSIAESVNYLDVGLKLEVTPDVKVDKEIQIGIKLEVSNIVKEIKTTRGLVAYQIGTRNASTILQLKDNETQMLAGLIKSDIKTSASHLPGIGKLPLLGRLFSSTQDTKNKSEIVLLITPKIIRPFELPEPYIQEHISGTLNEVNDHPLRLTDESIYLKTISNGFDSNQTIVPSNVNTEKDDKINQQEESKEESSKGYFIDLSIIDTSINEKQFLVEISQKTPEASKIIIDINHPDGFTISDMTLNIPSHSADYEKINEGTRIKLFNTSNFNGKSLKILFSSNKKLENSENVKIGNYSIETKTGDILKHNVVTSKDEI